ncbi:unnamed protein product [Jaminaea pallidilutea]
MQTARQTSWRADYARLLIVIARTGHQLGRGPRYALTTDMDLDLDLDSDLDLDTNTDMATHTETDLGGTELYTTHAATAQQSTRLMSIKICVAHLFPDYQHTSSAHCRHGAAVITPIDNSRPASHRLGSASPGTIA